MLDNIDISKARGRVTFDRYVAIKGRQGGRTQYTLNLPLIDVPAVVPVPDPTRPTPGNRRVNPKHASDFGRYVRDKEDWVAPPLMLRDSGECVFEEKETLPDGSVLGILSVPHNSRNALKIIDGQHRVLGLDILVRDTQNDIDQAEQRVATISAALSNFKKEASK